MTLNRLPDYIDQMLEAIHLATKILLDYPDFSSQHAHIAWASMKGMCNRIAHSYYDINLDTVWETIQTALPALRSDLTAIKATL